MILHFQACFLYPSILLVAPKVVSFFIFRFLFFQFQNSICPVYISFLLKRKETPTPSTPPMGVEGVGVQGWT